VFVAQARQDIPRLRKALEVALPWLNMDAKDEIADALDGKEAP
jgi:hypothetical protein